MNVLIAIDDSPEAKTAIDEAAACYWPEQSKIRVVNVADSFLGAAADETRMRRAQKLVDDACHLLESNLALSGGIDGAIVCGNPKTEIVKAASNWPADLLILGSRGRKGLSRVVLGSVSHAALMAVSCSVRIARKLKEASPNQRVILCLDESKDAARVIRRASLMRWPVGTEFVCVYALPTLGQYLYEEQNSYEIDSLAARRHERAQQAMNLLEQITARLNGRLEGCSVRWEILDGDPREAIVNRAKSWGATLIMMGCKGKNWMDRILVGSVSESVATYSNCSVEVVKH